MSTTKIWFNRWFSEAYNIIDLIRKNDDGKKFEIFVSHPNKYSLNLQNADTAFIEPILSDEDYIQYCLDICKRYDIDVFAPYHKALLAAKNINKFKDINTKVLVAENIELLELIGNKVHFYEDIKPRDIVKIPEYSVATTKAEFIAAYNKIKERGRVCFKPVSGVGGIGFKAIKESKNTIEDILNSTSSHSIYYDELIEALPARGAFQSVMVMEYLDGYEYSIDCLADKEGRLIAAIPRKKIDKYNRYLENNKELINIADKISKTYKIPYAYNIQVKYKDHEPNLLEINTRMAAGVYYSYMAGINIPYEAVNLLLNNNTSTFNGDLKLDVMIGSIDRAIFSSDIEKHIDG